MTTVLDETTTDTPEPPDLGDEPPEGAEPEPPDGDQVEPEAQAPLGPKEIEKLNRALEREKERHTAAITKIMGDDAVFLVECVACDPSMPGWHWPADALPDGDPRKALYELLDAGDASQMRHPERYAECRTCAGYGVVLTGARNETNKTIMCNTCMGLGYEDLNPRATAPTAAPQPTHNGAEAPAVDTRPDVDQWGRPKWHHFYGRDPAYLSDEDRVAEYPGVTGA